MRKFDRYLVFAWGFVTAASVLANPTPQEVKVKTRDSLLMSFMLPDNRNGFEAILKGHFQFDLSDSTDPVYRGLIFMARGRDADARDAITAAMQQAEHDSRIEAILFYIRSQCQLKLGDLSASLADLDRTLALAPFFSEAWSNRSLVLTTMGRAEDGLASSDSALARDRSSCKAWNNRGFALSRLKREEEATKCFDSALANCPDFDEALFNRGLSYVILKDYQRADSFFRSAVTANPNFGAALYYKGVTTTYLDTLSDSGFVWFDSSIAVGYKKVEPWLARGMLLGMRKRYKDAITSFDSAIRLDPENYWLKGQRERARTLLRDSLGR